MLSSVSARELFEWRALWQRSPWGAEADDWRTAFTMSAMNGATPEDNRPKWATAEDAAPRVIELTFDQAAKALAR